VNRIKYHLWNFIGNISIKFAYFPRHHIWGWKKNDRWMLWWERYFGLAFYKRCDLNDFLYGPSDLAETLAKKTGYWNLEAMWMNFNDIFSDYHFRNPANNKKPMSKEQLDLMRAFYLPVWLKKYQVRKYIT